MHRSGNTHIHLAIAGHPMISAFKDEVMVQPFYTEGISAFTRGSETHEEKVRSHMSLFAALTSLAGKENIMARGLHSVLGSPSEAETVVRSIQNNYPGVKIILISRLNIIARLASHSLAKKNGVWVRWESGTASEEISIGERMDPDFLSSSIRSIDILHQLRDTHDVLDCIYEYDIENDSAEFLHRAFDFLGVPQADLSWPLTQKIAPPPHLFIRDYRKLLADTIGQIQASGIRSAYAGLMMDYLRDEYELISSASVPLQARERIYAH